MRASACMIMERNLAFESDPEAFREQWLPKEQEISRQIERARVAPGPGHAHQPRPAFHCRADRLAECRWSSRRSGDPEGRPRPGRLRGPDRRSTITTLRWPPSWPCRTASSAHRSSRRRSPPSSCRNASSSWPVRSAPSEDDRGARAGESPAAGKKNLKLEDEVRETGAAGSA